MTTAPEERPLVYYRLGYAPEKEPLAGTQEYFDGLVVGGHVFAWGQSWITVFLQTMGKPFFIDPMTYVFAKDPSFIMREGSLRKSYDSLKDWLDWKLGDVAGRRPLRPEDFVNDGSKKDVEEFVLKVLEFQKKIPQLSDKLQSSLEKYGKIVGEDLVERTTSPQLYLLPYFHATDAEDPWYQITLECARAGSRIEGYEPIVPVLCVSESFIADDRGRTRIYEDLSGFDTCGLWVSGFNEYSASSADLGALKQLVGGLAENGTSVINLYGGHLSLLLFDCGIKITCCGPGYGESKNADQVASGGGFPERYYIRQAKRSVVEANARTFLSRKPEFLCGCQVCKGLADSMGMETNSRDLAYLLDVFFQELRGMKSRMHHICCRAEESATIGASGTEIIKDRLLQRKSELEDANSPSLGISTDHLGRWANLL